ncbi:hypothetical protein O0I10_006941 [Lichtheimia ornata]|uniref:Endosomal sorting complex protein n=1 Tax=Lichtheimia ornata TaxID=688661 RepID=A0AAD7V4A7_9FUNG|nr:uncharacterized protein O0I10_006941 [Lichtheimia ornata]KAJ8657386.1 hypothetical protein O0I10_006941 [Lichtheimia ornata]
MDIKNWLQTVLQSYKEPDRTFRDVDAVLEMYSSLKPKMDTYTYNDGHTQLLLCVHGTVPITYRSIPYYIPVAFWIPSEYPRSPPMPYVKPTSNMLVREGKHVDKSGLCYHPYRSSWKENPNKHNLLELVAILQQVFAQEPPVYSVVPSAATAAATTGSPMLSHPPPSIPAKVNDNRHSLPNNTPPQPPSQPPAMPPPPPQPPHPVSSTSTPYSPSTTTSDSPTSRWPSGDGTAYYNIQQGLAAMSLSPQGYTSSTPPPMPTSTSSTSAIHKPASLPALSPALANSSITTTTSAAMNNSTPATSAAPGAATPPPRQALPRTTPESRERDLQDRLYRKVAERMQAFNMAVSGEMDKLLVINRQLNDGENEIRHEQQTLTDMLRRLQDNIHVLKSRDHEIQEITDTVNAMPDMAVDEALCGTTIVYNQLFDLVADDNAIVDTIYYLGKALNSERIDLVTFMKLTRTLAREQFMKRALMKKIGDALKPPSSETLPPSS